MKLLGLRPHTDISLHNVLTLLKQTEDGIREWFS